MRVDRDTRILQLQSPGSRFPAYRNQKQFRFDRIPIDCHGDGLRIGGNRCHRLARHQFDTQLMLHSAFHDSPHIRVKHSQNVWLRLDD